MNNNLYFHNDYHYGDCLFSLHSLINICKVNELSCEFCCHPHYHKQLKEFVPKNSKVVITDHKHESSMNLWGGLKGGLLDHAQKKHKSVFLCNRMITYEDVYKSHLGMAQILCERLNVKCLFNDPKDMLFNEETLLENPLDLNFDYLIINSYCLSGQVKYSRQQQDIVFAQILKQLKAKNKTFITTKKLQDYPSTEDFGFSLVQIGQLSKNCKNILGIPTAPFLISMNKFSFYNYRKIINITHDICTFDLDERCVTVNSLAIPLFLNEVLE